MKNEMAYEMQNKTIRKAFIERSDFIIIGLTGAIGGDLRAVTNVMEKNFEELGLSDHSFDTDLINQLEYSSIYNYAKENWKNFDLIRARDIIITYILENYSSLNRFYCDTKKKLFQEQEFLAGTIKRLNECKKKLYPLSNGNNAEICEKIDHFIGNILQYGLEESLLDNNRELNNYIIVLRSKTGAIQNARIDLTLFVYTKYILPTIGNLIRDAVSDGYVRLFQRYGNELRFFGTLDVLQWKERIDSIENSENLDYCYSIAKRINTFIKIRRSPKSNQKSVPVRIVIESLKNPYEFSFLRDRYSAYYTFAVLSEKNEEYDDNRFAKKNHNKLLECPNLIKNSFKEFIRITREIGEIKNVRWSNQTFEYIDSLVNAESFLQYIYRHLPEKNQINYNNYNYNVYPLLNDISYKDGQQKYEQAGILEEEFKFYLEILKEPIRTFCIISDLFPFYLQDIQSATQNSDVFFCNRDSDVYYNQQDYHDPMELTYKIVRYISLIMHPGLVPPTKEERCMQVAFSAKVNSGCISRQVGAVVTDKDYNILSIGWNDVHCGKVPCIFRSLQDLQQSHNDEIYSDLELRSSGVFNRHVKSYNFSDTAYCNIVLNGLPSAYCFKSIYNKLMHGNNPDYSRAIHAEARAFWACNKELAKGGSLFTTSSSCENCTLLANEYGMKNIYYIEKYAGISQEHVSASGKKENRPKFILFEGAIGNAYMKMYTPVMPLKDELMLRGIERIQY